MEFYVSIQNDRRNIRLKVEQVYLSPQLEKYKITARNKVLVLQSNRPLLKARSLKNKRPDWKLIEGNMHNSGFLEKLIDEIETYVKDNQRNNLFG